LILEKLYDDLTMFCI